MKISLLTLLTLFTVTIAHAQKKQGHYAIKLNLTSLFDQATFPTLKISLEKKMANNFSFNCGLGYQIYNLSSGTGYFTTQPDTTFVSASGYKTDIEWRYYLKNKSNRFIDPTLCFGLNFLYQKNKSNIGIEYAKDSIFRNNDCFWLRRRNIGLCWTIGLQQLFNKIVIEIYLGAGTMNRKVVNYNREYNSQTDVLFNQRHNLFGIGNSNFSENNGWYFFMQSGLSVGILLD